MQIINKRLEELQPYENNPRKNDVAVEYVAQSIKDFGFKVPIVIDKKGVIVAGHTRYLASIELGLEEVPCVVADDLSQKQIKAFRLVDNKVAEYSSWDFNLLDEELSELDFDMTAYGFDDLSDGLDDIEDLESKYTTKVKVPQYEVQGDILNVDELYDTSKAESLIDEIKAANIDEGIKEFLTYAAFRHTVFNYKNVAEFYAQADKEVQELMERSALVIIDFDDAIANGYARLEESILEQIEDDE